jgi:hypothetical protein
MTVAELIAELKKCPNWNAPVVIYDILNYSFQHATPKEVTLENKGQTVYIRIKHQ